MLLEHTERHPIRLWHQWALCFNGLVMIKRGDLAPGLGVLRRELDHAGEAKFLPRFLLPLGELAAALGAAGETGEALALVDETLARCRAREEHWYLAELLRIQGELRLRDGSVDAAAQCFADALAVAREQGALFWMLRGALSAARLELGRRRPDVARDVLAPVCDAFSEGFEIADLRAARALLAGR
jgi:predicted ATPase